MPSGGKRRRGSLPKLSPQDVLVVCRLYHEGKRYKELQRLFPRVSRETLSCAVNGRGAYAGQARGFAQELLGRLLDVRERFIFQGGSDYAIRIAAAIRRGA